MQRSRIRTHGDGEGARWGVAKGEGAQADVEKPRRARGSRLKWLLPAVALLLLLRLLVVNPAGAEGEVGRATRLLGETLPAWLVEGGVDGLLGTPPLRPAPQVTLAHSPPPLVRVTAAEPARAPSPPPPLPPASPPPAAAASPPPTDSACRTCVTADMLTFNSHAVKLFSQIDGQANRGLFVRPLAPRLSARRSPPPPRSPSAAWACRSSS